MYFRFKFQWPKYKIKSNKTNRTKPNDIAQRQLLLFRIERSQQ